MLEFEIISPGTTVTINKVDYVGKVKSKKLTATIKSLIKKGIIKEIKNQKKR